MSIIDDTVFEPVMRDVDLRPSVYSNSQDWLARLRTDATLKDLPAYESRVDADTPGRDVGLFFETDPDRPGVIVCRGDMVIGLISRANFHQRLSRRFGRELFLTRPVSVLLAGNSEPPLRLPSNCRVGEAARISLQRPHHLVYEPLLVDFPDGTTRLLDVYTLLLAQPRLLELTQVAMVQSEKLAGLGELAAGMAHEINNPLAFVSNNVAVLQRDVKALTGIVAADRHLDPILEKADPQAMAEVRQICDAADLGYTLGNVQEVMVRSREGLRRIQQIVTDLRNFARLDESDLHEIDINASVNSTINIILSRARERNVLIEPDLGKMPMLNCYPAKINQVVMNLLVNAIDACGTAGRVLIRTRQVPWSSDGDIAHVVGMAVQIEVIDNGSGIDPQIHDRIFDPFFTTKPPGSGTGLGLSISHGIIRDHHGRIEVESTLGKGSTFRVILPIESETKG